MTSILVTGGSGFIGRYFCERFVGSGRDVTILDIALPTWQANGVRVVHGDVRDPQAVRTALAGCSEVFHLAAAHHDFGIEPETYFDVNERGSQTLLHEMERADVRRVCFYSSAAVYGEPENPRDERSVPKPKSPYGASKFAAEGHLRRWTEAGDDRRALIIRPGVVFGPRNRANVYALMRQIHRGVYLPIGPGTNVKSMAYVDNLIDATLFLWERATEPAFDVYNYIDLPDLTSREICDSIAESLGKRSPRFSVPLGLALALAAPFDAIIKLTGRNLAISSARVRKLAMDETKLEAEKIRQAGFTAKVPLREGIRRMAEWLVADAG